jgi:flavin-dependent dehydrogenase
VTDVVIAGGGPSGLAAAIMARQAGLSVTVYEPKPYPIDKACGEGLMPPALDALRALGIQELPGKDFEGIRYVDGDQAATGRFLRGPGRGVRRTTLQRALLDRAEALGVSLIPRALSDWRQMADHVEFEGHQARYMIAADGLHSPIRQALQLGAPAKGPARLGIRRHFSIAPWSDFVEVHWADDAEAYVTPVGPNEVGVALLYRQDAQAPGEGDPWQRWIAAFPDLASKLSNTTAKTRGAGPFEQRVRSVVSGRVLLVGDAAGYLDPITGEGIRLGLDTARSAVDAICLDTPRAHIRRCRQVTWRYWSLTSGLLFLRHRTWMRRRIVPTLRRWPRLFSHILEMLNNA